MPALMPLIAWPDVAPDYWRLVWNFSPELCNRRS